MCLPFHPIDEYPEKYPEAFRGNLIVIVILSHACKSNILPINKRKSLDPYSCSLQLLLYVLPMSGGIGNLTLNLMLLMILIARLIIPLKTDFKWNAGITLTIVCK